MRTIKQLLQVMLDNQQYFSNGLCAWATDLYWGTELFEESEYEKVREYIRKNRPNKFSSIDAFKYRNREYYWTPENINPRIKWLKKHIKKNS